MNVEEIRQHCLSKLGTTEDQVFGPEYLLLRVGGKIYGILSLEESPPTINLKCDPELAIELRETHPQVKPGYHMNKQHWNTITADKYLKDEFLKSWINASYDLIFNKLPLASRKAMKK